MQPKPLLVDGTNIVMRCAYALFPTIGMNVERAAANAAHMIRNAIDATDATVVVVALDTPGIGWRKLRYADYKLNRAGTPPTAPFSDAMEKRGEAYGWIVVRSDGAEADDLIATINHKFPSPDTRILSGDSDLFQLATSSVAVLRPASEQQFTWFFAREVFQKYGVLPWQLAAYKALVGEPGDNLPGVPGIGPKRAAAVLAGDYNTVRHILDRGPKNDRNVNLIREHGFRAMLIEDIARLNVRESLDDRFRSEKWLRAVGLVA